MENKPFFTCKTIYDRIISFYILISVVAQNPFLPYGFQVMRRLTTIGKFFSGKNLKVKTIERIEMGILWEVVQTGLMYGQKRKSDSIEDRVQALEDQLQLTQNTLRNLVKKIEEIHRLDVDGDGRIG